MPSDIMERGMIKWMPFSSLIEQGDAIEKMKQKRTILKKPILLSDKQEEMNYLMQEAIQHSLPCLFTIFAYTHYEKIEGIIQKFNTYEKTITLNSFQVITLSSLLDIKLI